MKKRLRTTRAFSLGINPQNSLSIKSMDLLFTFFIRILKYLTDLVIKSKNLKRYIAYTYFLFTLVFPYTFTRI